jgi:hypothetical protein
MKNSFFFLLVGTQSVRLQRTISLVNHACAMVAAIEISMNAYFFSCFSLQMKLRSATYALGSAEIVI